MTHAIKKFENLQRNEVVIIGDNMETGIQLTDCITSVEIKVDFCTYIIGGIEADIETVLLFSGVTAKSDLHKFPYRPSYVFEGLGEIV